MGPKPHITQNCYKLPRSSPNSVVWGAESPVIFSLCASLGPCWPLLSFKLAKDPALLLRNPAASWKLRTCSNRPPTLTCGLSWATCDSSLFLLHQRSEVMFLLTSMQKLTVQLPFLPCKLTSQVHCSPFFLFFFTFIQAYYWRPYKKKQSTGLHGSSATVTVSSVGILFTYMVHQHHNLRLGFLFSFSANSLVLASNQASISLNSGCHNHIAFGVQTDNGTIVRWFSRRKSKSSNRQQNHYWLL